MEIVILGTRGIPASHGGFETFAEKLSLYLVEKGWKVSVYCQEGGKGSRRVSEWRGVRLIHIPVAGEGAFGSLVFDWKSILDSVGTRAVVLTLGYNTALFSFVHRVAGQVNVINMDGIEWRRDKWGTLAKAWFWFNEKVGCLLGNHLIADHPEIENHLARQVDKHKITMIPYGADEVAGADEGLLASYGLEPGGFSIVVARPEPENSILEIVRSFSRSRRRHKLAVLGAFSPGVRKYHRDVLGAASDEVVFLGGIYDPNVVKALRFYSQVYLHGHRVGGTNPSLVEAMGAGCAVIAHDNPFNRWVAGDGNAFFKNEAECGELLDRLIGDGPGVRAMGMSSLVRFRSMFLWPKILDAYERLLVSASSGGGN